MKAVVVGLQGFAASNGVKVKLARDPFDVLEALTVGPEGALAVVAWGGDRVAEGDFGGPAEHTIEIVLGTGLGLEMNRDWRLIAGKGNRRSTLDLIDELKKAALTLTFPGETTSGGLTYQGAEPYSSPEGIPLAAYKLRFALVAGVDVDDQP